MTAQPVNLTADQTSAFIRQQIADLGRVDESMTDSQGRTFVVAALTPRLAEFLLTLNVHNRAMRKAISKNYEADMVGGRWQFTGAPICISSEGALLDGQHRLLAATHQPPGWSADTLIVLGLSPDAQEVMDQGRKRQPGQQLQLAGFRNAYHLAAAIKMFLFWQDDQLFSSTDAKAAVTVAEIQDYAIDHPDAEAIVSRYHSLATKAQMTPSPFLAFAIAAHRIDPEFTDSILFPLADGANLSSKSPVLALRNRNIKNKMISRKDSEVMQLAFLIRTWNYLLEGRQITRVQLPEGGSFNRANFPVMEGSE